MKREYRTADEEHGQERSAGKSRPEENDGTDDEGSDGAPRGQPSQGKTGCRQTRCRSEYYDGG